MQEANTAFRYALLHLFEDDPSPRYFGIILRDVDHSDICPPLFNGVYAFQWLVADQELPLDFFNPKGEIEKEPGIETSQMFYIAKRMRPEQVSKKARMHVCDKDMIIRRKPVVEYLVQTKQHLLVPYLAHDMEYELFVPEDAQKDICVPMNIIQQNFSCLTLETFLQNKMATLYYNDHC